MEGKIEDEVIINIRPVSSLLVYQPDPFYLERLDKYKNNPILEYVFERLDSLHHGVGNPAKLKKLEELEAYLTSVAIDFKEAFDEYKELYNEFVEIYTDEVKELLVRNFATKKRKILKGTVDPRLEHANDSTR